MGSQKRAEYMEVFNNKPSERLDDDATYLGKQCRGALMDLVYQVRFEFMATLRDENKNKTESKNGQDVIDIARTYQDKSLMCAPNGYHDPPTTPKRPPFAGFWIDPRYLNNNNNFNPWSYEK